MNTCVKVEVLGEITPATSLVISKSSTEVPVDTAVVDRCDFDSESLPVDYNNQTNQNQATDNSTVTDDAAMSSLDVDLSEAPAAEARRDCSETDETKDVMTSSSPSNTASTTTTTMTSTGQWGEGWVLAYYWVRNRICRIAVVVESRSRRNLAVRTLLHDTGSQTDVLYAHTRCIYSTRSLCV